ncbi:patatin-like phospholipase family protein [Pseudoxanthomonas sp. SGNA-20]|uniref:NTE family protein n=1 Tax=Pseudoxanthomonas taiwanensis J19 TaxID=935569 RepID=A0A562E250_9GAMM|nr:MULTISPECIES: patatin-like phospholipase family protein [Pseudoxanthomonas]RRN55584.1 patatin-like phospholipase family protein [Pseudoxanthomonas sp. SGNA-20]TWH16029.1 NTE family protein [Pseudoxanthomonas taiwanensis J19]
MNQPASRRSRPRRWRLLLPLLAGVLLAACGGDNTRPTPPQPVAPVVPDPVLPPPKIGLALGGGAAKGFAHIGVIKMLEANGLAPDVVAGTSAGSVVGALYAGGMDPFQLQEKAVALDEAKIRDVRLFSGGLIQGVALQDYVNAQVGKRPIERLRKPFAAVATRLETGERTVFVRGNTGQAVRASSSVPGVFEPVTIGQYQYVDGGVVSPVPVDAARQLGADFVIAVDISSKATGKRPDGMLGIVNQSISIMGQRLGEQELARADVVIRPNVLDYGSADFTRRNQAILEGEKAALAALPQIRAALDKFKAQRLQAARAEAAKRAAAQAPQLPPCKPRPRFGLGRDQGDCIPAAN